MNKCIIVASGQSAKDFIATIHNSKRLGRPKVNRGYFKRP